MKIQGFFLAVFFAGFFWGVFGLETAFGLPLVLSRMDSRASSLYIPAEPMYLKGCIPFRCRRLLTASDAMPNAWAISRTVIPSIYNIIGYIPPRNQVGNVKMFRHRHTLLYICIVKTQKNSKFLKNSAPTLDDSLGRSYTVIMFRHRNIKENSTGETGSWKGSKGTEGDSNEERRTFQRCFR